MHLVNQPTSARTGGCRSIIKALFTAVVVCFAMQTSHAETFTIGDDVFYTHELTGTAIADFDAVTDVMATPLATATFNEYLCFADNTKGQQEDGYHIRRYDMLRGYWIEDYVFMPSFTPEADHFVLTNDSAGNIVAVFVPKQSAVGENIKLQMVVIDTKNGSILRSVDRLLSIEYFTYNTNLLIFEPVFAINGDASTAESSIFFSVRSGEKRIFSSLRYNESEWAGSDDIFLLEHNNSDLPEGDLPTAFCVLNPGYEYSLLYMQDANFPTTVKCIDKNNQVKHGYGSNSNASPYLRGACAFTYQCREFMLYGSGVSDKGVEVTLASYTPEFPATAPSAKKNFLETLTTQCTFTLTAPVSGAHSKAGAVASSLSPLADDEDETVHPLFVNASKYTDGLEDAVMLSAYVPGFGLHTYQVNRQQLVTGQDAILESNSLTLEFTRDGNILNFNDAVCNLQLYSSSGQLLRRYATVKQLDIAAFAPGLYLLAAPGATPVKFIR